MERWIRRWGALILLNAAFLGIGLSWLFLIPYNNAPDENTHFAYSVEFIRTQRRLPVWGVDDAERFRFALSSYNQMPALNYVAAAAAAQAGGRLGLEPWQGARLASLAWGLVFLNGLFLAVRALAGRTAPAALVTGALAFIPQVLFTFCYVNADAHSLAIAALLAWAGARLIRRPGALTLVLFGLAGGLLFSAKYNYFIYVPLLAAGFGWLAWRRVVPWRRVWQAAGAAALGAVLISGFWYARNLRLYGSPLPLLLSQARLAAMGVIPDLVPTDRGLSLASLAWMMNEGFGATTFASFFGLFGYLDVAWPPAVYAALRIVIPALFAGLLIELLRTRDRPACLAALWTLGALLAILALHVWACLRYDYQPQGRYYFTGLAPLAACLGWLAGRHRRFVKYPAALLAVTAGLVVQTQVLFIRTYAPPLTFALFWDGPDGEGAAIETARRVGRNALRLECADEAPRRADRLQIRFPKRTLGRYRAFTLTLETESGTRRFDRDSLPPWTASDMTYDAKLHSFDAAGPDPILAFTLPPDLGPVRRIEIETALERRRLRDPIL